MIQIKGDYTFYQGLDSYGFDIKCVGSLPINELKQMCDMYDNVIGFNTLGFLKYFICKEQDLKPLPNILNDTDGLYVHNKKYIGALEFQSDNNSTSTTMSTTTFVPTKKSSTTPYKCSYCDKMFEDRPSLKIHTTIHTGDVSLTEKKSAEKISAENSPSIQDDFWRSNLKNEETGFWKKEGNLSEKEKKTFPKLFNSLNSVLGGGEARLEDEKSKKNVKKFRVKMICDWASSVDLCKDWNRMCQGDYRWNDIEITWENENIDFYVIINKPCDIHERYIPNRTIVLQMEPWCPNPEQNWGVKTWGYWAKPSRQRFLQVRSHDTHLNTTFWQLKTTYSEFKNMFSIKKYSFKSDFSLISSICSSKYFDPGHIKRIDFLKFVESKNDDLVKIDIYNTDNQHNFRNYKGPHPVGNKDVGIMPYKYYFMPENNEEHNFITEKIWEPLLCETLCFYWGCPNISEWIDPRSFILLDMNDFEKSFNIIKSALINDEWSKRLDIIRREKQKVLDYYNFFPTLERVIKQEFKFDYNPSHDEIEYHKYFANITTDDNKIVCFIHSCTINKNTDILRKLLNKITESGAILALDCVYVINVGDEINFNGGNSLPKLKIINYSSDTQLFEKPTIKLLHLFSKFNDCKILYLHTKGITNPSQNVMAWVDYMLYFLVDNHKICIDLLDIFDTVGCNLQEQPKKHYSGNFWWADSSYIKNLNPINLDSDSRHDCEWFILNSPDGEFIKPFCLFDSKIDHYQTYFPQEAYKNKIDYPSFYKLNDRIRMKCVNLLRRPDRKEKTISLLKNNNLLQNCDFIEAVDGKQLFITEIHKELFKGNDFGSKSGVVGCALSHYEIWKDLLKDNNYGSYLVIEDDITFSDNFLFKFNYILNMLHLQKVMDTTFEWDIVYLGYFTREEKPILDKKLCKITEYDTENNIGGTIGYLISKPGADKILKFIEKNGIKHGIDYLMFHYHKEMDLKQFQIINPLIFSECARDNNRVDSDIQYDMHFLDL